MAELPEIPPWVVAATDQMDARHRDNKNELRRIYEEGPGPAWTPERPLRVWEEGGVWCAVLVGPIGALCGYARLPDGHPWCGVHFDEPVENPKDLGDMTVGEAIEGFGALAVGLPILFEDGEQLAAIACRLSSQVPVHGGVTYTGPIPIEGAPHGWWLGFDCSHSHDGVDPSRIDPGWPPAVRELMTSGHIWTEEEVAMEIKRMVPAITEAMGG